MSETERQRQTGMRWMQYWKASIPTGEQSWLDQEQAQETMTSLHGQVNAYNYGTWRRDGDS